MKKQNSNLFLFITTLFVTCLLIANIASFKLIQLGPIVITSGVLLFPVTYIVNDLVAEVYGFEKARKVIWLGFLMNLLLVGYFQLAIHLPYPAFFDGQAAFASVLGNTWRALLASFTAYLTGSFLNATVMSKMKKKTQGKGFFQRAVLSTLIGEFVDSLLFVFIMFVFTYDIKTILIMVLTQTLVKTVYEIIIFPVTNRVVKKVKEFEQLDVIDTNISYNPFRR
jgi:uncharacterized integral membrane protein (TIGR00697 family)